MISFHCRQDSPQTMLVLTNGTRMSQFMSHVLRKYITRDLSNTNLQT